MIIIPVITIIVIISFIVIKNKKKDVLQKKQINFDVNFENYTAYEQIKHLSNLNINTLEYPFDVKMYLNYVILLHDHEEIISDIENQITYLKTKNKNLERNITFKCKYATIERLETDYEKLMSSKKDIIETIYKIIQEDYFVAWFPRDEKVYDNKLVEILTDIDNVIKIPVPMTNDIAQLIIDDFNKK